MQGVLWDDALVYHFVFELSENEPLQHTGVHVEIVDRTGLERTVYK